MRFLSRPLLLLPLTAPVLAQMKFIVQYEDQCLKRVRLRSQYVLFTPPRARHGSTEVLR